ncbi:unnamed protein product, partial [Gulo gulo]
MTRFSACPGAWGTCWAGPDSSVRLSRHSCTTSCQRLHLPASRRAHLSWLGLGARSGETEGASLTILRVLQSAGRQGAAAGQVSVVSQEAARRLCLKQVAPGQVRAAWVPLDPDSRAQHGEPSPKPALRAREADYFGQQRRISPESQAGGWSILRQEATAALPPSDLSSKHFLSPELLRGGSSASRAPTVAKPARISEE